jgi:agmatinase
MKNKEEVIKSFDPNGPGISGHLFGLPFELDHASLLVIPVPWEVTVSYHAGAANGPQAILEASSQLDLFMQEIPDAWKLGIYMLPVPENLLAESTKLRELVAAHIKQINKLDGPSTQNLIQTKINEAGENLNIYVKSTTSKYLKEGKMVGLVGGDHSTPLGFLRA